VRVTFSPAGAQKLTFNIRGHAADLAPVAGDTGEEEK
jgi:hypothetical protein